VRDALLHVSDHGTPPDEATPDGTIPYCFNFLTQRANLKATDATATAWTEVATTQPTTVAGAIALIDCYLGFGASALLSLRTPQASRALRGLRAFLRNAD
jgi:hypothetical protein